MRPALRGSIRRREAWFLARVRRGVLELGGSGRCQVVIDTGFTGSLSLPASLLRRLDTDPFGTETYRLADGRLVDLPVHIAKVEVGGRVWDVEAIVGDGSALIGMELLEKLGKRLELDFESQSAALSLRPSRALRRPRSR